MGSFRSTRPNSKSRSTNQTEKVCCAASLLLSKAPIFRLKKIEKKGERAMDVKPTCMLQQYMTYSVHLLTKVALQKASPAVLHLIKQKILIFLMYLARAK